MGSSIPKYVLGAVLGLAAGLFLGAVLWAKATPRQGEVPQVLRAQRFEVVDKAGNIQAQFGLLDTPPEVSRMNGITGQSVTLLMNRTDKDGKPSGTIMLNQAPDGSQGLALIEAKAHTAIGLWLLHGQPPYISLLSSNGKTRRIAP